MNNLFVAGVLGILLLVVPLNAFAKSNDTNTTSPPQTPVQTPTVECPDRSMVFKVKDCPNVSTDGGGNHKHSASSDTGSAFSSTSGNAYLTNCVLTSSDSIEVAKDFNEAGGLANSTKISVPSDVAPHSEYSCDVFIK